MSRVERRRARCRQRVARTGLWVVNMLWWPALIVFVERVWIGLTPSHWAAMTVAAAGLLWLFGEDRWRPTV